MILPSGEDRRIVVFLFLRSMSYSLRLRLSFGLIAGGLVLQAVTGSFFSGVVFLALGNLLLLVKGYDNRVDFGAFEPDTHWERVDIERLEELRHLDKRIRRWDRSALDVSNPLGALLFVMVAGGLTLMAFATSDASRLLTLDAIVLLIPHWFTGFRTILVKPKLLVRVESIETVLEEAKDRLEGHQVIPMMLLRGAETRIPEDVKFKVEIAGHHEDFLGLYGQVVINQVQGKSYPYFYVVLVAREGFGLHDVFRMYRPAKTITKELKRQKNVEVMVIRQRTSKTTGYHTKAKAATRILLEGLSVAQRIASGVPA